MPTTSPTERGPAGVRSAAEPPRSEPRRVTRTLINFWLDAALLAGLVVVVWVSTMLRVIFPSPAAAAGWTLWGLTFDDWFAVQYYALCGFVLLAIEHLVLHWNWVCSVLAAQVLRGRNRPDEGVQAVYGVATFIGIMVVMLALMIAALLMVKGPPR